MDISLKINEVCGYNTEVSFDDQDERRISDYIEIINTSERIFYGSLYLSDDEEELKKLRIDNVKIDAGGYYLIPLGGDSFGINKEGETIFLSNKYQMLDKAEFGKFDKNQSFSRIPDGEGEWVVGECSPNKDNYLIDKTIETPEFSVKSGVYENAFVLELNCSGNNTIYYTTDGSEPNEKSTRYTEEIKIDDRSSQDNVYRSVNRVVDEWADKEVCDEIVDKATVIRAIAVSATGHRSPIGSEGYIINHMEYANKDILFINTDGEDLFGKNGIYTVGAKYDDWYLNGMQGNYVSPLFFAHGRENEIKSNLILLTEDSNVVNQNVGIRISGGDHRRLALKRLSAFSRTSYSGTRFFDSDFLNIDNLHSMGIRYGDVNAFLQNYMSDDENLITLKNRPVVTFINGEFFYNSYLTERYDDEFFANRLGINKEDIIFAKDNELNDEAEANRKEFDSIREYVNTHDLSDDKNYDEFENFFDIDGYIDFICFCTYFKDMDVEELNRNVVLFKTKKVYDDEFCDGRWHYALQDLDNPGENNSKHYGLENDYTVNSFSVRYKYKDSRIAFNEGDIFKNIKNNQKFRDKFVARFTELANTKFSADSICKALDDNNIDSKEIDYFREFCENRGPYICEYMAEEFGINN